MATKLPVPRVEIDCDCGRWTVELYFPVGEQVETYEQLGGGSPTKAAVIVRAKEFSLATGWPLVIDGKVVT